jgi:hypothetical protein
MAVLVELGGERVLRYEVGDPALDNERRVTDLIGEAMAERATTVAVPVALLPPDFFHLRSGVAGMIAQKFVNYRLKLAIIGDIASHVETSDALRDWVRESNRGGDLLFLPGFDALAARLGADTPPR